jgi:hypothetical protein
LSKIGESFALKKLSSSHVIGHGPMATPRRELPKTKAELREMLAEAYRNTQPEVKRPPPAKEDCAATAADQLQVSPGPIAGIVPDP